MGDRRKPKGPKSRMDPPGGLAGSRPEQSSGEQKFHQAALSPTTVSRPRRILNWFKGKSPLPSRHPSPSPGVGPRNSAADHHVAASASQPLACPASTPPRPLSPYSDSKSIASKNPAPHIQTSTCQGQAPARVAEVLPTLTLGPDATEPPPHSSVWDTALDIAQEKLREYSLPELDLTNLTSQSAIANIEAVFNKLNVLQEDVKKKRWSFNWHGKDVIIVEQLGKILRSVDKYSKVVDTVIQVDPQVSAIVWASIRAMMQVSI